MFHVLTMNCGKRIAIHIDDIIDVVEGMTVEPEKDAEGKPTGPSGEATVFHLRNGHVWMVKGSDGEAMDDFLARVDGWPSQR